MILSNRVASLSLITSHGRAYSRILLSTIYLINVTFLLAMNETSSILCGVSTYLRLCGSSKVLLLVPGFAMNIFVLVSLVSCLLSRESQIRSNVALFILGSTSCNLVNLSLWPMTIHWRNHGRWLLGSQLCEVMVSAKHLTSSASFHYVSFITFSVYLTVVCGRRGLVNSRTFLALELLFPLLPVGLRELSQWLLGTRVEHLDPVNHTCFSFINDEVMRVLILAKIILFLPLNLYFYAHVLYTIIQSAKLMHRSQAANVKLAKVFSLISLITLAAHVPGKYNRFSIILLSYPLLLSLVIYSLP